MKSYTDVAIQIRVLNKFVVSAKAIAGDKHVIRTFYFEVKNLKKE